MSRGLLLALVVGTGVALSPAVATAHHSLSAEFDQDRPIEFSGTVVKIDWLNPHTYTHVEVEQEDGTKVVYKVEGSPPNALYRAGWRKDSLPVGEKVTVRGIAARNPESTNVGSATITNAAGERVFGR